MPVQPFILDLVTIDPANKELSANFEITIDVPTRAMLLGFGTLDQTVFAAFVGDTESTTEKRTFKLFPANRPMPSGFGLLNPLGFVECCGVVWFIFVEVDRRLVRAVGDATAQQQIQSILENQGKLKSS